MLQSSKALGKEVKVRETDEGTIYYTLDGVVIWDTSLTDADYMRAVLFLEGKKV